MSYTRTPSSLSACCSGCAAGGTPSSAPRAALGDLSLTNPWVLLLGGFLAWKLLAKGGAKKREREYHEGEARKKADYDRKYREAMQRYLAQDAAERGR